MIIFVIGEWFFLFVKVKGICKEFLFVSCFLIVSVLMGNLVVEIFEDYEECVNFYMLVFGGLFIGKI